MAIEIDYHLSAHIDEDIARLKNTDADHFSVHIVETKAKTNEKDDHFSSNSGCTEDASSKETDEQYSPVHSGGESAMASETDDHYLSIVIGESLPIAPPTSFNRSIFRVPKHLRNVNEKAYEPYILAIGPYHRGKNHLKAMEEHKKWYLTKLLERRGERDVTRYVKVMRALEVKARAFYADDFSEIGTDEFVEMMLLDGCFIVELLRRYMDMVRGQIYGDSFISFGWITKKVGRDLLLVENQLPFFVLHKLFSMTRMSEDEPDSVYSFHDMIFNFFSFSVLPDAISTDCVRREYSIKESKHLLSLVHDNWLLCCPKKRSFRNLAAVDKNWKFIRCASELKEAGIKFKKAQRKRLLFDIKFEKGIMKIPRIEITDETESFFRNLIVYEQFSQNKSSNCVSDYIKFMDCLINSQKDVQLLCKRNIIHNCLGDDEVVANMFNRLGDFVTFSPYNHYFDIFRRVNKRCSKRRNTWIANLRLKYFNTPWAFISFFAAFLLLLFTLAQTLFSALQYFQT